jgi:hypothetical protein
VSKSTEERLIFFFYNFPTRHKIRTQYAIPKIPKDIYDISLFRRAFQFTMCYGPTNALVCNKTLIQMSHIKTFKITPTCFDHQMIIIRELFDPG